ncbi:siderophore-interacting protein [Pectobacterium aroidearum]|uniref:Siderophore-interacting protein n=1 Tax=Pectobacterium aroidearum TaxID=1201031 RepID=A0AAW3SV78_9GAMM|nr:siderophore-interacting protein [Pectobacterium aroidearum]MBA5205621.1 siderophore-interacting protein [Pectobacterium aroidearum]MBA5236187.1 siderophore-interacting protein [Pectobacterium aroidearum]MBA5602224.1 siderophore-interacting protein [Pectobacterium aroidearum]UUE57030.1 siderophore-interacting protein [Pectobacterium aroidearum]UUE69736.1 siderophore-interacting protein [Pectobacterium aroidearum]
MKDIAAFQPQKRTSLLESAVLKLFTRKAKVMNIEDVGTAFRIITLGGNALRDIGWAPGDKIQMLLGGWVQRTYTPIEWDVESGCTRIMVHLHSGGPGEQWVRNVRTGDECDIFGPRASLNVSRANGETTVFGDETSIGLIRAISAQPSVRSVRSLLEVTSISDTRAALASLDLRDVELFQRLENDVHLEAVQQRLLLLAASGGTSILTGKMSSIQRLRRALKASGVSSRNILTKPYWALGRTGLD